MKSARRTLAAGAALLVAILALWFVEGPGASGSRGATVRAQVRDALAPGLLEPAAAADAARTPANAAVGIQEKTSAATGVARRERESLAFGLRGNVTVAETPDFVFTGATVAALDHRGEGESDLVEQDGRFALYGLGPGTWEILVEVPGVGFAEDSVYLSAEEPVGDVTIELVPPRTLEIDLSWEAGILDTHGQRGTLHLVAHRLLPKQETALRSAFDEVASASQAIAQFRSGQRHNLILGPESPPYLSLFHDEYRVATRTLEPNARHVRWHLDRQTWPLEKASLRLRCVDAQGSEVPGGWSAPNGWACGEVRQEPDGVTFISGIQPGWRLFRVGGRGYEVRDEWIFLSPGAAVEREVALERGVFVAGIVSDPEGEPANVALVLWRLEEGRISSPFRQTTPQAGGRFRFAGLRPGRYLLRTLGPDEHTPGSDAASAWASDFIELDVRESIADCRVSLREVGSLVLDPQEGASPRLSYRLEDARGRWLRTGSLSTTASRRLRVARGAYTLIVHDGDTLVGTWPIALGTVPVRIEL